MAVGADIPDIWIREEASVSQQVSVVLQNTYNQAIGIILNLSRWAQALFSEEALDALTEKALDALTKDEKSFLWLTRLIVSDAGPTRKLRIPLSDLIGSNSQIDFSRLCLNYPDLISLETMWEWKPLPNVRLSMCDAPWSEIPSSTFRDALAIILGYEYYLYKSEILI